MSQTLARARAFAWHLTFALLDDVKKNVKIISVVLGPGVITRPTVVFVIHCSSGTRITCACLVSINNYYVSFNTAHNIIHIYKVSLNFKFHVIVLIFLWD